MIALIIIPTMLISLFGFIFGTIYLIWSHISEKRQQKRLDQFFEDSKRANEEATEKDEWGQTIKPDWFKEKYPKGVLGVLGLE